MTSLLETPPRVSTRILLPAPPPPCLSPPTRGTESSLYLDLFHLNLELYLVFSQLDRFLVDHRSMEWRRRMARTGCKADRAAPPFMFRERRSLFASLRVPSPSIDFVLDRSRLFQTFRSTRIRSTRGSSIRHCRGETNLYRCPDTVHQPKMFIIRRCTRTHTYTHTYIYIYIYIYAHNTRTRTRGNFLYSRQITGHASLSREAKRPFETLSPLLSGSSAGSSERPENSPFTFSHLLPPPWIRGGGSSGIDPRYPRIHRTKNLSLSLSLSLPLSLSLSLSPWKQSIERHEKGRKEGRRNGSRFAGLKRWKKTWDRFAFSRTSVSRELFIDSADKEVPRACSPAAGREWTGCARLLNTIVAAESRGL